MYPTTPFESLHSYRQHPHFSLWPSALPPLTQSYSSQFRMTWMLSLILKTSFPHIYYQLLYPLTYPGPPPPDIKLWFYFYHSSSHSVSNLRVTLSYSLSYKYSHQTLWILLSCMLQPAPQHMQVINIHFNWPLWSQSFLNCFAHVAHFTLYSILTSPAMSELDSKFERRNLTFGTKLQRLSI